MGGGFAQNRSNNDGVCSYSHNIVHAIDRDSDGIVVVVHPVSSISDITSELCPPFPHHRNNNILDFEVIAVVQVPHCQRSTSTPVWKCEVDT